MIKKFFKNNWKILLTIIIFLLLIGAGIYLISLIPKNENTNGIQNIVLTVFSAILGGGLTLVGVAWTIKHEMANRKKDENFRYKPYFALLTNYDEKAAGKESIEVHFRCSFKEGEALCHIGYGNLFNSDKNYFEFDKISVDGVDHGCICNAFALKEQSYQLVITSKALLEDGEHELILYIRDSIGKIHLYRLIGKIKNGRYEFDEYKEISQKR